MPEGTSRSRLQQEQPGNREGQSGLVVLPVDPHRVHVYWRIEPPGPQQEAQAPEGEAPGTDPVLRFHAIAASLSDPAESGEFFEVPVKLDALNWYVHLPKPSGRYRVELGFRAGEGRFTVLARSPLIQTPPVSPSENVDEMLMLVMGDFILPNPYPKYQHEQPAAERSLPPPTVISDRDHRSGSDSVVRSFPLPPPSQGVPLTDLGSEQAIALALTPPELGTGATTSSGDCEHRLVEWNEGSFASGQSSVLRWNSR